MNKRLRKKKMLSKITDEELWGLDVTLAKYILPRLEKFKKVNVNSHPIDFKNIDEWHKVIDKMIYAFEFVLKNNTGELDTYSKEYKLECFDKYKEGMKLFSEYFMDLWD